MHKHEVSSENGTELRVKEILPPLPKSVWTTSIADLTMTPQVKALRAKATHDWLATKIVLAKARAREVRLLLKNLAQQSPTEPLQQATPNSSLPVQLAPNKPTHSP